MRWVYAGYRLGDLKALGLAGELTSAEFVDLFSEFVVHNYHFGWIMSAPTTRGTVPVGMVFGQVSGPAALVGDFTWFQWASPRNIVEATAHFFEAMRHETPLVMYVLDRDENFATYMKKLGLIRPVGRVHDVMPERAMFYQTRRA